MNDELIPRDVEEASDADEGYTACYKLETATETVTEERVGILMKILTILYLTVISVTVMAVRLMTMEPPMDLLKQPRT